VRQREACTACQGRNLTNDPQNILETVRDSINLLLLTNRKSHRLVNSDNAISLICVIYRRSIIWPSVRRWNSDHGVVMKSKQTSQFDVVVLKPRPLICICRSTATNRVPVKNRRYELLYIDANELYMIARPSQQRLSYCWSISLRALET